MTNAEKKNILIKKIMDIDDERIIDELFNLFQNHSNYSKELLDSIDRGIEDAAQNKTRPHEVVMEEFKKKYGL